MAISLLIVITLVVFGLICIAVSDAMEEGE